MRVWQIAAVLLSSSLALAQPMMLDPSKMSGIPRPDPQVPPGTITVRIIRGDLSNRVTSHPVELLDGDGKVVKTEKTNEEGRATFSGLGGGPFIARALDGDDTLTSQPMELPGDAGVRVMLVFKNNQPGAPDGVGRPDKSLPAGVVVVRAVGPDQGILPGLEVKIGQARAGESQVIEHAGKTNDLGEARFTVDTKPTSGYLAEVIKDGTRFAGKPFRMPDNLGVLCVIQVNPVSKDLSGLKIAEGSHFIIQVTDDAVQLIEVLRLSNPGATAVEVPGGLHIALPDEALQATPGQQSPPNFSVNGHSAVWKGPLPPGDTELQLSFVLTYKNTTLDIVQKTPIAFAQTALVTEKIDGFTVEAEGLESEERELQGRKLVIYRGPGTSAGGEIRLHLVGLPHATAEWRYLAAVLTVLVLLGFGLYAASGDGGVSQRRRALEARREALLDELVALEKRPPADGDSKRGRKRDELKEKLAQLYRDLDQLG